MSRVERTISNRVAGWVLALATLMLLLLPATANAVPATANAVPAAPSGPSLSWTKPDASVPRAVQQQPGSRADTAWASEIEAKSKKKGFKAGGIVFLGLVIIAVVVVVLLVRKKRRSRGR